MKKFTAIIITSAILLLGIFACRKEYNPPEIANAMSLLVVDGTILCGNDAVTTITLSRTARIGDSVQFVPELNAVVHIEQEQGGSYMLQQSGNGTYVTPPLNLDPGGRYRLRIFTSTSGEYLSDYAQAKRSPEIDSLNWKQDRDVTVYVSTHDPSNNTRYYRWDYIETWNYQSQLHAMWGVKDGMVFLRDSTTQVDSCWRTANSTNIVVGNSIALGEDVISRYPVAIIPQHSEKISKGYSILVRQYGLEEGAFRYLQLIQKNTQQLGTLFDAQPSQLTGNIRSTGNPNEPVIGYVAASTVTEKRLFIRNQYLDWDYQAPGESCSAFDLMPVSPVDYRIYTYPNPDFAPYYFISQGPLVVAPKKCLDCTALGGTNVKPSFW